MSRVEEMKNQGEHGICHCGKRVLDCRVWQYDRKNYLRLVEKLEKCESFIEGYLHDPQLPEIVKAQKLLKEIRED